MQGATSCYGLETFEAADIPGSGSKPSLEQAKHQCANQCASSKIGPLSLISIFEFLACASLSCLHQTRKQARRYLFWQLLCPLILQSQPFSVKGLFVTSLFSDLDRPLSRKWGELGEHTPRYDAGQGVTEEGEGNVD